MAPLRSINLRNAFAALLLSAASALAESPPVTEERHGNVATLQNGLLRVDYDLSRGTYSVADMRPGGLRLIGAYSRWNDVASTAQGMTRTCDAPAKAVLGAEGSLYVTCRQGKEPYYGLEFTMHKDSGRLELGCAVGTENTAVRISSFEPMAGARLQTIGKMTRAKTLDGFSGALQTEVSDGPYRTSNNDLLLTFVDRGKRRSVAMGGLTYHEFCKIASSSQGPPEDPSGVYLGMKATDPVGKMVDLEPGFWVPNDRFYLDIATADPFEALEAYGLAFRKAQHCRPNPYDFPTVCAWYAGVWKTPGAQNHPGKSSYKIATTPGLVEEADKMRASGFLNYSRAAGRLVPDNYTENNPQGWWDDAHWQREGFYVAPYETSRKWGNAMHKRGALAFTYFQPAATAHSLDFRKTHRELLIGGDVARNLDYTKRATQAYMRGVYANMCGAIDGMMFDYCDELWTREASKGGFWDRHVTATAFYRMCLQLAKTGLGPRSWIHERAIGNPGFDIALGISDSQRTSNDTDKIDPGMVSKSGLRWYKNRVVVAYDMDSKEVFSSWKVPGFTGTDRDGRRMMLTMAYVAASRLLLANSFREMTPEVLYDLERTFPYPKAPRSARPVDAFVAQHWPQVYDYPVDRGWHQLTLFNATSPTRAQAMRIPLSAAPAEGGLGLSASRGYHVYDFWNDRYVGLVSGSGTLEQTLRPGEARMLSIHRAEPHPQFISTNRHLMQGLLDMVGRPAWDARSSVLRGVSRVVRGEIYKVVLALNGWKALRASAAGAKCRLQTCAGGRLAVLSLDSAAGGRVRWRVWCRR